MPLILCRCLLLRRRCALPHALRAEAGCLPLCPSRSTQYKLNDRAVSWEQYNKKLEQYNILVKARNFLVFQVGAGMLRVGMTACRW